VAITDEIICDSLLLGAWVRCGDLNYTLILRLDITIYNERTLLYVTKA